jgi:hypothetical protein
MGRDDTAAPHGRLGRMGSDRAAAAEPAGFTPSAAGYEAGASAGAAALDIRLFGRYRHMKVRLAAAVAVTAALTAPAAAGAAAIAPQGACFVSGAAVPIVGNGFTPAGPVSIGGGAFGSTVADAAGNIAATVPAPPVTTVAPQTVTVSATDGANPANVAGTQFPVIARVFNTNAPLNGRPRQKATWRFSGFPAGTAIYGHYRFHGRTMKNYRFGKPVGPCGTLTARARRMPMPSSRIRGGTWTLQLDQRRHYRRSGARRVIRFRIIRTLL